MNFEGFKKMFTPQQNPQGTSDVKPGDEQWGPKEQAPRGTTGKGMEPIAEGEVGESDVKPGDEYPPAERMS